MKMSYGFVDYAKVVAKFGERHIAPGGRVEHLEPVADDVQKLQKTGGISYCEKSIAFNIAKWEYGSSSQW